MKENICEFCGKIGQTIYVADLNMRLCKRHSSQYYEMGKLLTRTKFDPNEIVIYNDYADIIIYDKNNKERCRSKIDLEDVALASKYKWSYSGGYCYNHKNRIHLHNVILNRAPDKITTVDHINRDRMDNRKSNLRIADYTLNGFNKGKQSNNTSGYVGVSWDKQKQKWEAHIKINRKKKFLGYFDDVGDAVKARHDAEIEYYGELRNNKYDKNTVFKNAQ